MHKTKIALFATCAKAAEKAEQNILRIADKLGVGVQIDSFWQLEDLPIRLRDCSVLAIQNEIVKTTASEILTMLREILTKEPQEVTVVDFVMPIGEECFKKWTELAPKYNITIPLPKGQKIESVNNILYFENKSRKIYVKTAQDYYVTALSMKQAAHLTTDFAFSSPYVSFMINLAWVERVCGRDVALRNQEILPLSQKRAAAFRQQFRDFCANNTKY